MKHVIALCLLALPCDALAHSFYPIECCSGIDCAPADKVEVVDADTLRVTSTVGTTHVPSSMQRRDSKDGKVHVCMTPDRDKPGSFVMKPLCIFIPPAS